MNLSEALNLLSLKSPFTLIELKSAYRKAALKTHPDIGGNEAAFIKVDEAYDYLKSLAKDNTINASYWEWRLPELEEDFKTQWKKAYRQACKDKTGLWLSTCIERFSRSYLYPKSEWFQSVILGDKVDWVKAQEYRMFLISIAPNKRLAENWARKYYQLEFGDRTPWVFYLPGSTAMCG